MLHILDHFLAEYVYVITFQVEMEQHRASLSSAKRFYEFFEVPIATGIRNLCGSDHRQKINGPQFLNLDDPAVSEHSHLIGRKIDLLFVLAHGLDMVVGGRKLTLRVSVGGLQAEQTFEILGQRNSR